LHPDIGKKTYKKRLELHPNFIKQQYKRELELHGREYVRNSRRMSRLQQKIKKLNKTESIIG